MRKGFKKVYILNLQRAFMPLWRFLFFGEQFEPLILLLQQVNFPEVTNVKIFTPLRRVFDSVCKKSSICLPGRAAFWPVPGEA